MALHALNLQALQLGRYLGLQEVKEWAIRLMANVVSLGQQNAGAANAASISEDRLEAI